MLNQNNVEGRGLYTTGNFDRKNVMLQQATVFCIKLLHCTVKIDDRFIFDCVIVKCYLFTKYCKERSLS